jgi:hypothetical protein
MKDNKRQSKTSRVTKDEAAEREKVIERSRPKLEVIACVANCAGFYRCGIQVIFDLRDNETGKVFKGLVAMRVEDEWSLPFLILENLDYERPLPSALAEIKQYDELVTPPGGFETYTEFAEIRHR